MRPYGADYCECKVVICKRCHKRKLTPTDKWRYRKMMNGQCNRCSRKATPGKLSCRPCRKERREYLRKRRAAQKVHREE